ncbi:MAG: HD-GYP domain-containing protein [Tissierellales bacterium]|jgi:HD-GYP domain-containing protein (c-di-GMP phosphodiesterase class II)|nr:HD-GYP domain-containing protein [Tissierellales bacterium]
MKRIKVESAEDGMILGRDVLSADRESVLMTRNTVLDEIKIILLKREEIDTIFVRSEAEVLNQMQKDDDFAVAISIDEDDEHPKTTLEKRIRMEEIVRNLYEDARMSKKLDRASVTEAIDYIVEEVKDANNLFEIIKKNEDPKDYLVYHTINTSTIAVVIGNWLHYSKNDLRLLAMAGLLHDLGKMKISNMILDKPGKLTDKEFEVMKKHPMYTYNYLKDAIGMNKAVLNAVIQHHEREDGSGYPLKLKGDQIHPYAKILAIADVFDAITANRSYKEDENPFYAQEVIQSDSFSKLDPGICYTFLKNLSKLYIGRAVMLDDGTIGEIVYIHANAPTKPVIKVDENTYIDLSANSKLHVKEMI